MVVGHLSLTFEGKWLVVSKIWQLTSISLNLDYGVLPWDLAVILGKRNNSSWHPVHKEWKIDKFFRKLTNLRTL